MLTSIYLIRHAQTAWNKEEIFRGRTDIGLDEMGLMQAELVGRYFKDTKIDQIYSSPLSRSWQTAERIAQFHNLEVKPLWGIIDMSFGNWEGHHHKEIKKIDSHTYRLWIESPHLVRIPGGETLDEVRKRAMISIEEIIKMHEGENIVLVSHRVVNKVIICGILGIDNSHFWQVAQDPTAINIIQYKNGRYILSLMNDTCHLKELSNGRPKVDF